jgi:tetratricopeptide (TPR) repeat protein
MLKHNIVLPNRIFSALIVTLTCAMFLSSAQAQSQTGLNYEAERKRALQLYDDFKLLEALPILEKLAEAKPNDAVVLERLGIALVAKAVTVDDEQERKRLRVRARKALLRSKELGNNSNLLQISLNALPEDGSNAGFSNRKEVEDTMREGEAAFVKGDLDKAYAAYSRALLLDPKLYEAALFNGDVFYKKGELDKAGEWFARAVKIAPDRETAYRYWGDVLMAADKMDEARIKFLEAIIAEPYNRTPYMGLGQWAKRKQMQLSHPLIQPPVSPSTEQGKITINIDPKTLGSTDGSQHWLMYGIARAAWSTGKFAKEHPNEKAYRHSLREEAEALRMVAEAVAKDVKEGKIKSPHPSLEVLVKLNEAGLLESYILFARADAGIAEDYPAYRAKNRDKLMRYLAEYVAPAK